MHTLHLRIVLWGLCSELNLSQETRILCCHHQLGKPGRDEETSAVTGDLSCHIYMYQHDKYVNHALLKRFFKTCRKQSNLATSKAIL